MSTWPPIPHHGRPAADQAEGGDPGGCDRIWDSQQIWSAELHGSKCEYKSASYHHNYLVTLQVYKAKEDSDCCTRNCCGPGRWFNLDQVRENICMLTHRCFDMNITDLMGQEVIHLNRPLRCQLCCFPCCLQVSQELLWILFLFFLLLFFRRWRCPVLQELWLEASHSNGASSIPGQNQE